MANILPSISMRRGRFNVKSRMKCSVASERNSLVEVMKCAPLLVWCLLLVAALASNAPAQSPLIVNKYTAIKLPNPYSSKNPSVGNWHPSVVYFPDGWGKTNAKYWMAWTPYTTVDNQYENPCIAYSNDGINWDTTGLSNPVVDAPRNKAGDAIGYNSDPCLFYNPRTDSLYLVWRCSDNNTWLKKSGDGVSWGSHKYNWDSKVFIGHYMFRGELNTKICPIVIVEDGGNLFRVFARMGPNGTTNWGFARWTMNRDFQILDTSYFDIANNPDSVYAWHYDVIKNPADNHYYFFTDGATKSRSVWAGASVWVARSDDTLGKAFSYANVSVAPKGDWYKATVLLRDQTYMFWFGSTKGVIYHSTLDAPKLYQITNAASIPVTKPETNRLFQNFPNPFNSSTRLTYELEENSSVHISVFNVLGQLVKNVVNEWETAGLHTTEWDGTNQKGVVLSSGAYFIKVSLKSESGRESQLGEHIIFLK